MRAVELNTLNFKKNLIPFFKTLTIVAIFFILLLPKGKILQEANLVSF